MSAKNACVCTVAQKAWFWRFGMQISVQTWASTVLSLALDTARCANGSWSAVTVGETEAIASSTIDPASLPLVKLEDERSSSSTLLSCRNNIGRPSIFRQLQPIVNGHLAAIELAHMSCREQFTLSLLGVGERSRLRDVSSRESF